MLKEIPQNCLDQTLYQAIYSPQEKKKLIVALDDLKVTFGLPPIRQTKVGDYLTIPDNPHVFNASSLTFITKRSNYVHAFTLSNQVVLLCHGTKNYEKHSEWKLDDGQSPFKIVQTINSLKNGVPKINVIIACRPNSLNSGNSHKHLPKDWPSVPNVIIQKSGNIDFLGNLINSRIFTWIISADSDYYQVNKHGNKLTNLRKKYFSTTFLTPSVKNV